MTGALLHLSVGRSVLMAVPAVHFHHVFAERVNRLCRNPRTRPDAIAVELGPETASAVVHRIRAIRQVQEDRKMSFPCMLGISKPEAAGPPGPTGSLMDAGALPRHARPGTVDGLSRHIPAKADTDGMSVSLLPLSPTDSMIEAVRCAVELDIPLYGVDIEDMPEPRHGQVMIQDPLAAGAGLARYVRLHLPFADSGRDAEIDDKRELVMTARLKAILQTHRRVLFTCGLAHWGRVRRMLLEPGGTDAGDGSAVSGSMSHEARFRTVILHPLMAVRFMDKFPLIAAAYEKQRWPADMPGREPPRGISPYAVFTWAHRKACKAFFHGPGKNGNGDDRHADLASCDAFNNYLMNLCVIRQLGAPDFPTVAQAAGAMMSREFCRELFARLMKIRWTTPSDFPGMALIGEPRLSADGTLRSDCIGPGFEKPRPVRIRLSHRGAQPADIPDIPWKWELETENVEHQSGAGYLRTWPAWDHLITGLGIKAKNHVLKNERIRTAAPFEGSLCEGLDVKATMRAYIKGERRIYVRDRRPRIRAETSGMFDFVPTVYIFDPPELSSPAWRMHDVNLQYMYHDHVKNGDLLKRIIREKGRYAVSAINFGSFSPIPGGHSRGRINLYVISGIVVFMPVYFNGIQEARWLEDTGYQRNPLHGGGDFSRFKASFKARYGIELSSQDWQNSLIRMAIPFAAERLAVIAPDGFTPSPAAHAEAGQKGIAIRLVPHSAFPRGQLRKASRQYCVEPLDKEGLRFPAWAHSIVADRIDAHKPLMPSDLLEYGME